MASPGPATLIRLALVLLLVLAGGGAIVWLAPRAAEWLLYDRHIPRGGQPGDPELIDAFLERELGALGATEASREQADGVLRTVHRMPPGESPAAAAETLHAAARREEIELYPVPMGDLDMEIRVYSGRDLHRMLVLRPALPGAVRAPATSTLRERPLLAVVLSDVGRSPPEIVTTFPLPLTLAIEPYQPWSLRAAESGMLHWHEILVDLGSPAEAAPIEQLRAVPYASGVVIEAAEQALPQEDDLPFGVVVHPEGRAPKETALKMVRAHAPPAASALEILARGLHLSARDRVATVVISAEDPALEDALQRLYQVEAQGFRLVLASEAARPADLRGDVPLPREAPPP